ncbi:cyclophilin family peptidyl-prolyl cis-trans isomerase Cyp8 [Schizosaccharomyces osmophilus]|uniref:Cyclophilin family peptidyl-prolyl cis-trans isomerase Cyp8 n=1 Tax=Schizosaccharomyces osmophilus TaxID=2545709 RepID=A0AAF0AZA1_9SCHI|nr:cyclophilin family peptidyl-prolyl cis-trans isomerase Cyp8 [Schizosaccharomyces osmophilus]WBW75605.1 cyclophilin family peptidyl-prolyl cis-trans isomerase Cyp8 [Schizosaccharomyces osmophilus]
MGKNTDKLYVTQTEHSGVHGWHGGMSGITGKQPKGTFRQLPFNYCSLSLQPFTHPCCLVDSTNHAIIFDFKFIVPWLRKHKTNPVTGEKAALSDLIKLNFSKNAVGEYCDPVTLKGFTEFSHIIAIKTTGNCFSWDTLEGLNIKTKNWNDLVSEKPFTRSDIITIQDPHNVEKRDFSALQTQKEMSREEKIQKARLAIEKSRKESVLPSSKQLAHPSSTETAHSGLPVYRAAHTTGLASASLTSTSFSPVTKNEKAIIPQEDYMLNHVRIKHKGYARMITNFGEINLELHTDYAPHAVYNFIQLSKKGYYRNTMFHRSIPRFMIQAGDPTGTGKGGESCWGKPFRDEFGNPLHHDQRGILSMANRGKNTNGSQFFLLFNAAKHLDSKHTIFGHIVGGMAVLDALEKVPTNDYDHPKVPIRLEDIVVFVDPFEEWEKEEQEKLKKEKESLESNESEADHVSWTGRDLARPSSGTPATPAVGKYLNSDTKRPSIGVSMDALSQPKKKKTRTGFGNFDAW